jgi:hypothetical protein
MDSSLRELELFIAEKHLMKMPTAKKQTRRNFIKLRKRPSGIERLKRLCLYCEICGESIDLRARIV